MLLSWLRKLWHVCLEPHDPEDYRSGPGATAWEHVRHACPTCQNSLSHDEFMLDKCYACGCHFPTHQRVGPLSWRKLWNGTAWMYQIKSHSGVEFRTTRLRLPPNKQV